MLGQELADLFEKGRNHHPGAKEPPEIMRALDRVASAAENLCSVTKAFYALLADAAPNVFNQLEISALLESRFVRED
jgi:hypothetical protein